MLSRILLLARRVHTAPLGAIAVEAVKGGPRALSRAADATPDAACGPAPAAGDDLSDPVSNVDPKTGEWGGPTKGGSMPEPTRFGDWERKGRCSACVCRFGVGALFLHYQSSSAPHSPILPLLLPLCLPPPPS
jgi:hypothetical protein